MRTIRKIVIVLGVAILGAGVGTAVAGNHPSVYSDKDPDRPKPVYPKNGFGETFGSLSQAIADVDAPNLISAVGINGVEGYVRSSDLLLPLPKSPAEALLANKNARVRFLKLYAVDGKTVIGAYKSGTADLPIEK